MSISPHPDHWTSHDRCQGPRVRQRRPPQTPTFPLPPNRVLFCQEISHRRAVVNEIVTRSPHLPSPSDASVPQSGLRRRRANTQAAAPLERRSPAADAST